MTIIITLLILGAALLFLETILPGLVAGIVGVICLLGAVIRGYQEYGVQTGNLILGGVLIGLVLGIMAWFKFFPNSRFAHKFISHGVVGELEAAQPELLNCTGVTLTELRPSGAATIEGKRVDVITEGEMIERGVPIKVVAVEGIRVVVREVS
jgi:membrane-bound serine protease (ClpP class)